jgi:hypothetical protein
LPAYDTFGQKATVLFCWSGSLVDKLATPAFSGACHCYAGT